MRSNRFLTRLSVLLLLLVFGSAAAQTSRRDFNRPQVYDAEHYILRVRFDRRAKKVIAETTIRFKPLKKNFAVAEFDAVGITFSSVTLEPAGRPLKFRAAGGRVTVMLDKSYDTTDTLIVRFKHSSTPRKGVYFVDKEVEDGKEIHSEQIWTQGEADEARHWFPSFDFPSDKATFEEFITANAGETVVGNGELLEEVKNADGTVTHHFRMNVPTPTYLVSFVIGKYAKVTDKYLNTPLSFYIYPGGEATARKAYGNTKEMMRIYAALTDVPFQFNKYDQTVVAGFTFGGMENVTATTMADTDIFAVNNPLFAAGVEDLVSHELAHSWFGNLVTCKNWAELWLNEGFATFMEAAFRENMYGRQNYLNKIRSDAEIFILDDSVNNKRNALFNQNADDVGSLFDRPATIYNKGGAVLHTLREEVGDSAFWKAVNIYLNRHKFGSVETTDLKAAMEEVSGRDLEWFFDQWIYKAGHPKLDITQVWNPAAKKLRLTMTQTQKGNAITPAVFRLPLDIEFTIGTEKQIEKINITKRVETFEFNLPARPDQMEVDPLQKVPVKTVKVFP
ncbi:MAG: M1 family metallopeptidase [Acidobacteriota bacterium]